MLPGRAALQAVRGGIRAPTDLPSGSKAFALDLERTSQPRVGFRRMDERIEEYLPVELRRPRHHLLGLTIHADTEARLPRTVLFADGGRSGARHIRSPYRKNRLVTNVRPMGSQIKHHQLGIQAG